jgi:hypothetical protein
MEEMEAEQQNVLDYGGGIGCQYQLDLGDYVASLLRFPNRGLNVFLCPTEPAA